jgi:hypothetical protein
MKDMRQPVNPRSLIGLVVRRKWLIITIALCFWGIDRLSIRASQSSISSPKTIAAERFLVVDSNGNERGRLAAEADGKVALVLWSREKSASASFQIDGSDMPRFVLENSKGNVVVDVGILRDDTPVILLLLRP